MPKEWVGVVWPGAPIPPAWLVSVEGRPFTLRRYYSQLARRANIGKLPLEKQWADGISVTVGNPSGVGHSPS